MQDPTSRRPPGRSRLRLRASTRSLTLRVSHQRPNAWNPPVKDDDDDDVRPGKKGGKRR